jgi:hypothetical protein
LRRWRVHRPASPTGLLFPTRTGLPVYSATLRVMVKRRERKAGLAHKDVHSPMLQYTCATELYRQTKDIRLLQKALGYADLSTMMIDTPIVDDSLETVESREEGEGKLRPPVLVSSCCPCMLYSTSRGCHSPGLKDTLHTFFLRHIHKHSVRLHIPRSDRKNRLAVYRVMT